MRRDIPIEKGRKIGKLTVIKRGPMYVSPKGYRQIRYFCNCECGSNILVVSGKLRTESVLSCGCVVGRYSDLKVGDKFGKWTVCGPPVVKTGPSGSESTSHPVECECGVKKLRRKCVLTRGKSLSCGCGPKRVKVDLTGKVYGRLTVIERGPCSYCGVKTRVRKTNWVCKCECGAIVTVMSGNLESGKSKSCGCLIKETSRRLATTNPAFVNHRENSKLADAAFRQLIRNYRAGAKKRGYVFLLTYEEVSSLTKGICHYCYRPPIQMYTIARTGNIYTYNGIDRKDNTVGYRVNNCVPCCKRCNIGKGSLFTHDEWWRMTQCYRDDYERERAHEGWQNQSETSEKDFTVGFPNQKDVGYGLGMPTIMGTENFKYSETEPGRSLSQVA